MSTKLSTGRVPAIYEFIKRSTTRITRKRSRGTSRSEPSENNGLCSSHMSIEVTITSGSSAPDRRHPQKSMATKNLASSSIDDLRPEYNVATLKGRVQGKYFARATASTTMVLLEPDGRCVPQWCERQSSAAFLPPHV